MRSRLFGVLAAVLLIAERRARPPPQRSARPTGGSWRRREPARTAIPRPGFRRVLPAVLRPVISAGVEPSGCAGVPAARALTVVAEGATADEIDRRSGNRGHEANTCDEEDSEEFADHEISRAHGAAAPCAGARAAIKNGAGKEEKRSRTACHLRCICLGWSSWTAQADEDADSDGYSLQLSW